MLICMAVKAAAAVQCWSFLVKTSQLLCIVVTKLELLPVYAQLLFNAGVLL
jgi:hypothetical protein